MIYIKMADSLYKANIFVLLKKGKDNTDQLQTFIVT